jgi:hypothetical protein
LHHLPSISGLQKRSISRRKHYDQVCRAIDAAHQVDNVKEIRDKALALEMYSRPAKNVEAERRCCEIRLRAERKAGELLQKTERAKGARGNPGGHGAAIVLSPGGTAQTLPELGITRKQSSQWQKLADVPPEEFEAAMTGPAKPTTIGMLAAVAPPARPDPVSRKPGGCGTRRGNR